MTSAAQTASSTRHDARTIVVAGFKLGVFTVLGVVAFALLTRVVSGTVELVLQSVFILVGGAVFAYFPSVAIRPHDVDTIAWAALVGLLGALTFTVVDTAFLRPFNLYSWTWDELGGGSGFWYIPVWWMGSAVLAWLGAWVYSIVGRSGSVNVIGTAGVTTLGALLVFALLALTRLAPVHSAVMALAFSVALVAHVPLAGSLHRQ